MKILNEVLRARFYKIGKQPVLVYLNVIDD